MILHGFAWRSQTNMFFQQKTLIFDEKSQKYLKIRKKTGFPPMHFNYSITGSITGACPDAAQAIAMRASTEASTHPRPSESQKDEASEYHFLKGVVYSSKVICFESRWLRLTK